MKIQNKILGNSSKISLSMMLCALSCIVNGTNYEEGRARSSHELQPASPDSSRATQDTLVEGVAVTINKISGEPFSVINVRRDTTLADVYEQIGDQLDSKTIYDLIIGTTQLRLQNTNQPLPEDSWTMGWQIRFSPRLPIYFRFNPRLVNRDSDKYHKNSYIHVLKTAVAGFIQLKYRDWHAADPERYPLYREGGFTGSYIEGDHNYRTLHYFNVGNHDHHLIILSICYDWDKSEGLIDTNCNLRGANDKILLQMIPEEDRIRFLEEVIQDININKRDEFIGNTTYMYPYPLTTNCTLDDYPPYPTGPLFNLIEPCTTLVSTTTVITATTLLSPYNL